MEDVLCLIGQGARDLCARTRFGDSLATRLLNDEKNMTVGERIIATEFLIGGFFRPFKLACMARAGRFHDVIHVLDALDNLPRVSACECYVHMIDVEDPNGNDADWLAFEDWKEGILKEMRLCVNMLKWKMIVVFKICCIRLRQRCAAPGGVVAACAAKRFKKAVETA